MAPTPTRDIDVPALGDTILEFLCAIWVFVRDLCLAVWSSVSDACWAVWTYPPFETFRNELAAAFIVVADYVVANPITSLAIIILTLILLPRVIMGLQILFLVVCTAVVAVTFVVVESVLIGFHVLCLHCLSFRREGVLYDSYAANYQSINYGGNVPRVSTFSQFQSQAAKGWGSYRSGGGASSSGRH